MDHLMAGELLAHLVNAVLIGGAAAYPLRALLLVRKDSHYGPLRSKSRYVVFPSDEHDQPVTLFDWIRRLFGVYDVKGQIWNVREDEETAERFTCPFCLSFWVALPFSIIYSVYAGVLLFPVIHWLIAIAAQLVYRAIDGE